MSRLPEVAVVMPTLLDAVRAATIKQAVDSVLSQSAVRTLPILIVNGTRFEADALSYWRNRKDVHVIYRERGDYLNARLAGREEVQAEYFGFLDDDDVYLPESLRQRVSPMCEDGSIDAVVGNGLIVRDSIERVAVSGMERHRRAPLIGLCEENWLPSCAGTFRTDGVGVEFFQPPDRHLEWTSLAFRLAAAGKKIHFVDELMYRINDTPGSLSKSRTYRLELADTLLRLLDLDIPSDARALWDEKCGRALHDLADLHYSEGNRKLAWQFHLRSLVRKGGLRYAAFTRRLLMP